MPSTTLCLSCRILRYSWAAAVACGVTSLAHPDDSQSVQARLATADTAIAIQAGEHAPRLTTLGQPGAPPWQNRTDEALPERAEVRGSTQALLWRLDRADEALECYAKALALDPHLLPALESRARVAMTSM